LGMLHKGGDLRMDVGAVKETMKTMQWICPFSGRVCPKDIKDAWEKIGWDCPLVFNGDCAIKVLVRNIVAKG
jgi:hypothetical protein